MAGNDQEKVRKSVQCIEHIHFKFTEEPLLSRKKDKNVAFELKRRYSDLL